MRGRDERILKRKPLHFLPILLTLPLGLLGVVCLLFGTRLPTLLSHFLSQHPIAAPLLLDDGLGFTTRTFSGALNVGGVLLLTAFVLGLLRTKLSLRLIQAGYVLVGVLAVLYHLALSSYMDATRHWAAYLDTLPLDSIGAFEFWWDYTWGAWTSLAIVALLFVLTLRRSTIQLYAGRDAVDYNPDYRPMTTLLSLIYLVGSYQVFTNLTTMDLYLLERWDAMELPAAPALSLLTTSPCQPITFITGLFKPALWSQSPYNGPMMLGLMSLAILLGVVCVRVLLSYRRGGVVWTENPARGDLILEDLRTHGREPVARKSWYSSTFVHVLVIIILPYLLSMWGCVENYRVPKGTGEPEVLMVVQVKKKEKKKKYIFNPNSAIAQYIPDLDESQIVKQVETMTQQTYVANNAAAGRLGKGGKGKGGWPDGMEDAKVRFIRLNHGGVGWDDGMTARNGNADHNFLAYFHKITEFKVADQGESHPIGYLAKYDKGYQPPFVYMTGDGNIGRVSSGEMKVLRDYLLEGGMLFADAASPGFDRSFRAWILQVLPGKRLVDIADDDPIYHLPFTFSNGAPPLWHHGGTRAMGIWHQDRWIVFYHPGDVNDAWKDGHSGLDKDLAESANNLGVNIVYHAFTNYLEKTRKYRK